MWLHKLNLDTFSRGEIEISQNMKKKETGSKITFDPAPLFSCGEWGIRTPGTVTRTTV